ncbi:hypothetical protein [Natrinema hispanicum]|uniref:Uncharacterized protein n=1 Tax=Natrinema hispanicum TaxID=392421 RepID=A0A1I0IV43_9EURY|nr:hypothetical protein [Natrinema hispanicum]SEU01111.1 hypothetical protein SAMN04488694_12633 [Natrinema hispanicum]
MVERKQIQTRVPSEWLDDAEELEVSQSEYARMMMRVGRRNWGFEHTEEPDRAHVKLQEESTTADEEIEDILEDIVLRNLSVTDGITKEDLVEIIFDDMAKLVGNSLKDLHNEDLVQYDPVDEKWTMTE